MDPAAAAPRRIVENHHQHFFVGGGYQVLSLLTHCWGDVFHIFLRRTTGEVRLSMPLTNFPLLGFWGKTSVSWTSRFSMAVRASSKTDTAKSISRVVRMSGGMKRTTGSK